MAALQFLAAMFPVVPADERVILCGFAGNPHDRTPNAWRPRPWLPGDSLPFSDRFNAYVCVSTFHMHADSTWRRRREGFAAACAVMVDDIGTKVPMSVIDLLTPSALIETSSGNFQAWYFLVEPLRDCAAFTALVDAFIAVQLLSRDPGMAGFNRVGRLPGYVNGKPQHGGWRCELHTLNGELRYGVPELRRAFKLPAARTFSARQSDEARHHAQGMHPALAKERIAAFRNYLFHLQRWNMLKSGSPDAGGWMPIRCPWTDEHTGRADSGAALRLPAEENAFHGAFRCHHGHCADRGWRVLTDWIVEQLTEVSDGRR